jgi:proline dehydrogenase
MLRSAILAAARNRRLEQMVTHAPVSRSVVKRFVGGADTAAAVEASRRLVNQGCMVTLDHLGEDTTDQEHAEAVVRAYLDVLDALQREGLTERLGLLTARTEVSVKLSAVGQALPEDGEKIALEHARTICAKARGVGATVTLDMEDHTTTDSTLEILRQLRLDFPETGAVLQAYLHRTEADCRDLAYAGSRVRLCKGAYDEPPGVAYQRRIDVNRSYVRCMNVLLHGGGYPMFATHDPQLIDVISRRAEALGKSTFEFQMLYGVRPDEQRRMVAVGHTVRVYLPYGSEWYGYLMRRLAERPANLAFFARALLSRG